MKFDKSMIQQKWFVERISWNVKLWNILYKDEINQEGKSLFAMWLPLIKTQLFHFSRNFNYLQRLFIDIYGKECYKSVTKFDKSMIQQK